MTALERLDSRVASAFYGRFPSLRPIQEVAIKPLLDGRNVVASSGTGSGKTEAVTAPLLSRYWRNAAETDSLAILYIAPTKALVNDLEKRLLLPVHTLGLRVGIRHGDRDDVRAGAPLHVLLTTPESLEVLLFRQDAALTAVQAVIIDEVHLLYNTQRGLQLSVLLHRLKAHLGHGFQWAALSATVGSLPGISEFLFGPTEEAVFLQCPTNRPIDAQIRHITDERAFLHLITRLTQDRPTKLLLFAPSRRECERLAGILHRDQMLCANIFAHYSSLSPEVRVETERAFAATSTAICIATSTLELGIDIGDIDGVVLWGPPSSVESFLQRVGRGNRRSTKTNAICLVPDTSADMSLEALTFLALLDAGRQGELPIRAPYELLGAVAQQCLSIIGSQGGAYVRVADLLESFSHQPYVTRLTLDSILEGLAEKGYIQHHGFKNRYAADEKLYRLIDLRMIYGNYALGSSNVNVTYHSKLLGTVPSINLLRLGSGQIVGFAGKRWRIKSASPAGFAVEPYSGASKADDFVYPGPGIGLDAFLTNRIWQILHAPECELNALHANLRDGVKDISQRMQDACGADQIPVSRSAGGFRYLTFAGYWTNKAIGELTQPGSYRADDVSLLTSEPINWEALPADPADYVSVIGALLGIPSEQSLFQTLLPLEWQVHEMLQLWSKDQTIGDSLKRLSQSRPVAVAGSLWG